MADRNAFHRSRGVKAVADALAGRAQDTNRIRNAVFDRTAPYVGPLGAQTLGQLTDFVPGVGDISGAEDAYQSFKMGDLMGGGIAAGATLLGLVPGVGDIASRGLRGIVRQTPDVARGSSVFADRKSLEEAIKNALEKYDHVGLRTVDSGHDPLAPSRVWVDGEPTEEFLDGVSVTDVLSPDVWSLHQFEPPNWRRGGYYSGDEVYVVGSNYAEQGEDIGEKILKDAQIVFGGRRKARD